MEKFSLTISLFLCLFGISFSKPRAIVFGIDGLASICIQNATNNTWLNWLMQNGAYTLNARTALQAVSAPGGSSIICALDPTDTGIIGNDGIPSWLTNKSNPITPITGNEDPIPCVFEAIKKQNSSLKTAFYHTWDWLLYLSNFGIKGNYIDDAFYCNASTFTKYYYCDRKIIEKSVQTINRLDFDYLFIYIASLDEVGHTYNWCSYQYEYEIGIIDGFLGQVIESLNKTGILEETYILLTSDHGGRIGFNKHGYQDDNNIRVPWIIFGPDIKKNYELKGVINNMDS